MNAENTEICESTPRKGMLKTFRIRVRNRMHFFFVNNFLPIAPVSLWNVNIPMITLNMLNVCCKPDILPTQ